MAAEIYALGGWRIAATVTGPRYGGRCFVLENDEAIVLAFRGTQTIKPEILTGIGAFREQMRKVLRDITTDAKTVRIPWNGRSGGTVHKGFADSLGELLLHIKPHIAHSPSRKLWLTGHSLGAGLATLAADVLDDVQGIHTFGSPQVGDQAFAVNFKLKGWRFRHHADAITWAPSRLLGYRHVEPGAYFDLDGRLVDEPNAIGLLTDWWKGVPGNTADALASMREGSFSGLAPEALNDHAPLNYAVLTWNAFEASLKP